MTEAEWLRTHDPGPMLSHLQSPGADRKLWLFSIACCRRIWHLLTESLRTTVMAAECAADGLLSDADVEHSMRGSFTDVPTPDAFYAIWYLKNGGRDADYVAQCVADAESSRSAARLAQVDLLRDIFGNPFRPIAPDPSWQTINIATLAQSIYDDGHIEAMPLLADLLEEAGAPADLCAHCRSPGPHFPGCWALDLILGKS